MIQICRVFNFYKITNIAFHFDNAELYEINNSEVYLMKWKLCGDRVHIAVSLKFTKVNMAHPAMLLKTFIRNRGNSGVLFIVSLLPWNQ